MRQEEVTLEEFLNNRFGKCYNSAAEDVGSRPPARLATAIHPRVHQYLTPPRARLAYHQSVYVPCRASIAANRSAILRAGRGQKFLPASGQTVAVRSPIDGQTMASITWATPADLDRAVEPPTAQFKIWRNVPAPRRGEFVRRIGQKIRERKPIWPPWSPGKRERSRRKRWAKCRR